MVGLTQSRVKLDRYASTSHLDSGPKPGDVFQPGQSVHIEVTW